MRVSRPYSKRGNTCGSCANSVRSGYPVSRHPLRRALCYKRSTGRRGGSPQAALRRETSVRTDESLQLHFCPPPCGLSAPRTAPNPDNIGGAISLAYAHTFRCDAAGSDSTADCWLCRRGLHRTPRVDWAHLHQHVQHSCIVRMSTLRCALHLSMTRRNVSTDPASVAFAANCS